MSIENRISLQKLEVFCTVAEVGGVRRAAETLFVSQPVVSEHLRSLQQRLGAELFHKDGRGIALTDAGQTVYIWAKAVLRSRAELDDALRKVSSGEAGSVHIAASMSVGNVLVTPLMVAFRREHPDIDIRVEISNVEAAVDAVMAGRSDFCIVATDVVTTTNALQSELVAEPRFALFASARNTALGDRVSPAELSGLSYVCPPPNAIRRSQDLALASVGATNRAVAIELGSGEAIMQAVAADLGVALLWRQSVAAEIQAGRLREVVIEGVTLRDKLHMVTRKDHNLTPAQLRVQEHLRAGIAAMLD